MVASPLHSQDSADPAGKLEHEDFDPLLEPQGTQPGPGADPLPTILPTERSYRSLHVCYAVVIFVLVVTGLPIQFPDLRASLIGGYGRSIATAHEWAGVAMLALPAIALAAAPRHALETIGFHSRRRDSIRFHAVNMWFTLLAGAVFIASGLVMWIQRPLPDPLLDACADAHRALSYVLYVMIPLHLVAARRRAWELVKKSLREKTGDPRC